MKESPLLGVGLGGQNQNRVLRRMDAFFEGTVESEKISFGPGAVIPVTVLIFTGILGLIPYLFVLYWLFRSHQTRIIAKCILAISFMWGNAFAPIIWWYICLAVSLRGRLRN